MLSQDFIKEDAVRGTRERASDGGVPNVRNNTKKKRTTVTTNPDNRKWKIDKVLDEKNDMQWFRDDE